MALTYNTCICAFFVIIYSIYNDIQLNINEKYKKKIKPHVIILNIQIIIITILQFIRTKWHDSNTSHSYSHIHTTTHRHTHTFVQYCKANIVLRFVAKEI